MKNQTNRKIKAYIFIVIATLLVSGCNPACVGILMPGQKVWHDRLDELAVQFIQGETITSQELLAKCGKPDAVVPGECFISNDGELNKLRAYCLRTSLDDLSCDEWRKSDIWIYDEKKHFLWPIVDRWRSHLFQVKEDQVLYGWNTYPTWIPWSDSYWDDVKKCMDKSDANSFSS